MKNGFVICFKFECFMNCSINNNVEGVDTMHSEYRKECLHVQGKVTTNTKHAFGMYDDIS
jgi:hypothetical protein